MKSTVSFSKNSTNLFFHILTICNLSCKHCYINREQHGEKTLPIETIEKWMELFKEKSKEINIIFLGGEPTLHTELSRAVIKANRFGYKSITIDTNGYLFHDFLSKVTPSQVDFISFSLDGATKETNDNIRGEGCYEKCITGIKESVKKGFKTSIIYTVSRVNIHELRMMVSLLKELKIDKFFIQVIGVRGISVKNKNNFIQVTKKEWFETIPWIAEKISKQGISVVYPKVFLEGKDIFECSGIVADNYFIFPNGRVYRCPLCEDFPLHSLKIENNKIIKTGKINEKDIFSLDIKEGCVMNKLIQPGNLSYDKEGFPEYKIACCLLKKEIFP